MRPLRRAGDRLREGAPGARLRRLDLVTLGTLADLMPLATRTGSWFARASPCCARRSERAAQVFQRKDLLGKRITTTDIAWQVVPLLNSAGRMGEPSKATRLFLSQTAEETEALVEQLFALDSRGSAWARRRGP